jgi:hypothetical protein
MTPGAGGHGRLAAELAKAAPIVARDQALTKDGPPTQANCAPFLVMR